MSLIICTLLIWTVQSSTFVDVLTLGRDANKYNGQFVDVGETEFNRIFREDSTEKIIKRECSGCKSTHQEIFYKRLTDLDTFNVYNVMKDTWASTDNLLGTDFELYSTLSDALAGTNSWTSCNYDDEGVGAFRDCGPTGLVGCEWTSDVYHTRWNWYERVPHCANDAKFSIYVETGSPTTAQPTTAEPTTESPTTAQPTSASSTGYSGEYIVDSGVARTGDEAKAYCNSLGLTLATVITSQDLTNLENAVTAAGGINLGSVWIGLRDDAIEGIWTFEDGTACPESTDVCMGPWDNANGANGPKWGNGEPNNVDLGEGGEDCGELYVDPATNIRGWLNDLPCTPYSATDWRRSNTACNKIITTTTPTTTYTECPDTVLYSNSGPFICNDQNRNEELTRIDLENAIRISMDITIYSFPSEIEFFLNIFMLGNDTNRHPGLWLRHTSDDGTGFRVAFTDKDTGTNNFDTLQNLEIDTKYTIDIYYDQTSIEIRVDDEIKYQDVTNVFQHDLETNLPVYVGRGPGIIWSNGADAKVENLVIRGGNCGSIPCPTDIEFIFVEEAKSYQDARKYCKDTYGTTLATISNDQQREDAIDLIGDEIVWFGLYSRSSGGKWRFLNRDECTDEDSVYKCIDFWKYRLNRNGNYRPRCIDDEDEGGYQCGNFNGDEDIADNDVDCQQELPFLCDSCQTSAPTTTKYGDALVEEEGSFDEEVEEGREDEEEYDGEDGGEGGGEAGGEGGEEAGEGSGGEGGEVISVGTEGEADEEEDAEQW